MSDDLIALAKLRKPFPANQIGMLPRAQVKKEEYDKLPKAFCTICKGYHPATRTIHLAFVGHAALTDRLLDADPMWFWEPLAYAENGLPLFDQTGGLWIKLTIKGVTRLGYGHAAASDYKEIGSREKEVIGDALRNAAMRFGAALELWHKGELHDKDKIKEVDEAIKQVNETLTIRELLDLYPMIMTKVKADQSFKDAYVSKRRSFKASDCIREANIEKELDTFTLGLELDEADQDLFNAKMDSFRQ